MSPRKKGKSGLVEKVQGHAGDEDSNSDQPSSNSRADKRTFHCHFCSKKFLRNEHLQRHERLHTKEKPFRCTSCSAAFTRSDVLARHSRLCHHNATINGDLETPTSHREICPQSSRTSPDGLNNVPLPTANAQGVKDPSELPYSNSISPDASFMSSYPETSIPLNHEAPLDSSLAPAESTVGAPHMPWAESTSDFDDFALFIDSITFPYGNDMSTFCFDQPVLNFSPIPLFGAPACQPNQTQSQRPGVIPPDPNTTSTRLLDEFTSTFPSFQTSSSVRSRLEPWKITEEIWNHLLAEIQIFMPILPSHLVLPSRHTMTRYIATYLSGFHRHLPLIHIPTFSPTETPVELILAMATIGAQSAFDHDNAIMLYRASLAIVQERLRCRKAQRRERLFSTTDKFSTPQRGQKKPLHLSSTQDSQPGWTVSENLPDQFNPLPIAQTLLILMAMATWGNSKAIFNEAVGHQHTLASFIREEKLLDPRPPQDGTWDLWIQTEGFNRTIAIIFCFFVFHTIVYDTPPAILNSELKVHLPSRETDWEAASEAEWKETRAKSQPESSTFQSSLLLLFSKQQPNEDPPPYSSLGGYTLILAIIQHIYFLRETSKSKPGSNRSLSPRDISEVETALRNWQNGWYRDPESFLGPGGPKGPISFNSTVLLRMAYIRLNVDVGPWRTLTTHNPHDIAASMHRSPHLMPNRKLTRAVLYSAHALSIPVKIGVNIVARNQAFAWSLQHALCALECAFVIAQWLIAVQPRVAEGGLDEEEVRLLAYITDMVTEADPAGEFVSERSDLCSRVIKIWAKLFSGVAVWDVVEMIGKALRAYGHILEGVSGVEI